MMRYNKPMRKRTCYKTNKGVAGTAFCKVLYICPRTERTTRGTWYVYGENYYGITTGYRTHADQYRRTGDYLKADAY